MKKTNDITLTPNQKTMLKAVYISADGNGFDFGYTSEAVEIFMNKTGLSAFVGGALLSTLAEKNLIIIHEKVKTDSGIWKQITFPNLKTVKKILGKK